MFYQHIYRSYTLSHISVFFLLALFLKICCILHFVHIPPKSSWIYLVSLETLESPLVLEIKFKGYEQSLTARPKFVMAELASLKG